MIYETKTDRISHNGGGEKLFSINQKTKSTKSFMSAGDKGIKEMRNLSLLREKVIQRLAVTGISKRSFPEGLLRNGSKATHNLWNYSYKCLVLCIWGIIMIISTYATPPATLNPGNPAGSYSLSGLENINIFNGSFNFTLPLAKIGGRGEAGYTVTLPVQRQWEFNTIAVPTNCDEFGENCTYTYSYAMGDRGTGIGFEPLTLAMEPNERFERIPQPGQGWHMSTLTKFVLIMPDGSRVELIDNQSEGQPYTGTYNNNNVPESAGFFRGKVFESNDGSNITFVSDQDVRDHVPSKPYTRPTGYLYMPNGVKYRIEQRKVTSIQDRNGNSISIEREPPDPFTGELGRITKATDSIGRQITYSYGNTSPNVPPTNPYIDTITFSGFQGATRTVKIYYDKLETAVRGVVNGYPAYSVKTQSELFPGIGPGFQTPNEPFNPFVVTKVELPDTRAYTFFYNSFAEIAQVTVPTGGITTYEHDGGTPANGSLVWDGVRSHPYRRLKERAVHLDATVIGKTTYSQSHDEQNNNIGYIDEDSYDNQGGQLNLMSKTRHFFHGDVIQSFVRTAYYENTLYSPWNEGREYKTEVFDPSNNLLRVAETVWQQKDNTSLTWYNPSFGRPEPANLPRIISQKSSLNDNGANKIAEQTFNYDNFNNLTDTYEYDFGDGQRGVLLRRTHTDYVTDPNYLADNIHLRSLPLQTWVSSDEAGNNKVSFSQIEYDNYASDANHSPLVDRASVSGHDTTSFGAGHPWRGNVTAATSFANAAAQTDSVTVFSQYDILGNVVKTIDGKGNASTISYNDNFGAPDAEARTNSAPAQLNGQSTFAFATSSTNALGWVTGYSQFDYFTGASVDAEDINSMVSSNFYNDPLDRPTQSIAANNLPAHKQQTTIAYDDTNRKITTISDLFAFGDNLAKSESFYDGLGRTFETRKYEENGGYISTVTEYDALSSVKRVTNPYRPLQSEPQLWSTTQYDALSRVVSVTGPDNAVVQTFYSGNAVIVTDQAGKQRRSITNGIGQLVRVDEPDDSGNLGTIDAPTQATSYLYDTLGKMVKVTQGVQSRFFKYDSLGRLLRVRQPEQDTNASLALADAVSGNNDWSAGFTYDSNGNLLTATDTKGTVITSTYDNLNRVLTRSYSDSTPQVTYTYDDPNIQFSKGLLTKTSNAVSSSQILSLDNLGRVLSSRQTTDGVNYDSSFVYSLAGAILEETYPSGRKVKNTFQTDGDLAKIETMQADGSYQARADNFNYAAHGAIKHLQIGNGLWESAQFNNRLQVIQLGLGTSATDTSQWKLDYDFGTTDNNGNIKAQTVTSPVGTYAQSFTYDALDRLKTANETSGGNQTWTQSFTYDRYGNRTGFSQTLDGNTTNTTPAIDQNTNRFNLGQGYTYDAAGNVITDNQGRSFTFNGDNKQTEVKDSANNTVGTYFYDGDGKRIKKVTSGETTTFVYSGGKLVAEYQLTTTTPTTATTQYLGTDMLGSPRVVSDQTGAVTSRRDFMPFGEDLTRANYGSDTIRQKFTGYEKDTETGLDFAEARYYNNAHGRFTAVDPLLASGKSSDPQTFNRYSYTMNNPLIMTDPSGMQAGSPTGIINPTGAWYKPKEGGKPVYIPYTSPVKSDYEPIIDTNRWSYGTPIYAAEGLDEGHVVRLHPNGPRTPQPTIDARTGQAGYEQLTDFERRGWEIIWSNEMIEPNPGVRNAIEPIDVALALTPFKFSASSKTSFFTVQGAEDIARLKLGGEPFPTVNYRSAIGEGVYAWDNKFSATEYLTARSARYPNLQIQEFTVKNSTLRKFSFLDVDKLRNPTAWVRRYDKFLGNTPSHGIQYIRRGTKFGTEHFFDKSVIKNLEF